MYIYLISLSSLSSCSHTRACSAKRGRQATKGMCALMESLLWVYFLLHHALIAICLCPSFSLYTDFIVEAVPIEPGNWQTALNAARLLPNLISPE